MKALVCGIPKSPARPLPVALAEYCAARWNDPEAPGSGVIGRLFAALTDAERDAFNHALERARDKSVERQRP